MLGTLKALLGAGGPGAEIRERALTRVAVRAASAEDLCLAFNEADAALREVAGATHVDIFGWTPSRDGLVLRAGYGWVGEEQDRGRVEVEGSLAWLVAVGPGPMAHREPQVDGARLPLRAGRAGLKAVVGAPLRYTGGGEGAGSLLVYAPESLAEGSEDFVARIAEILGAGVAQRHRVAALQREERSLRTLFSEAPDATLTLDERGVVVAFNAAAESLLGLAAVAVVGHRAAEIPALAALPLDAPPLAEVGEVGIRHRDGTPLWVEPRLARSALADGSLRVQVTLRDVTRRKSAERARAELEEHLAQARRLEAIGRMAGGVAHDFNNLLTIILTASSLLQREQSLSEPGRADLFEIGRAAERAATLTRQLLTFGRFDPSEQPVASVGRAASELGSMLRRVIGAHIQLVVAPGRDSTEVHVQPSQIEQIVVNLVLNARDALPRGGTIRVEVARSGPPIRRDDGRAPEARGDWVRLTVSDDGIGMDDETRAHMFEPFFTRKGPGEGTGLGLATVHTLVKAAGGAIQVDTAPGVGTRIDVYLPAAPAAPLARAVDRPARVQGLGERVLLVDDDDLVLAQTRRWLEGAGYRVIAAGGADDALLAWEKASSDVDVVVVGLDVSHAGGLDLIRWIRGQRSLLPAVLITGPSLSALAGQPLPPDIALVEKPYLADELLDAIRDVLDTEGTLDEPGSARADLGAITDG